MNGKDQREKLAKIWVSSIENYESFLVRINVKEFNCSKSNIMDPKLFQQVS